MAEWVLEYAGSDVSDPYRQVERLAVEREAFTAGVRSRLAQDECATFERLLACALANYPPMEDHAYWLDQQCVAAVRDMCAEFGWRLAAVGALDHIEDISYLTLEELILWGLGLADPLRPQVAKRKIEHQANQQVTPADLIGAPPEPGTWVDRYGGPAFPQDAGVGEIRGVGASAGVARGPARIAHALCEAQMMHPGEVLVAVSPDPNWTPLFGLAAALVTDLGGSLCHAAVVAREYGLPAVVGTHVATERIRNGQMIEVNGVSGIVRLL
ncbi:MAG TPA: PEP-utilizing enzyme [Anaerolineae bacterium]|nr:PEP-utilizing enzyme [Anaerolineae bacterium]